MKTIAFLLATALSASAALVEKTVDYKHGGLVLEGYHVYDDEKEGKRPAVLVVHQWTGLSDHEKQRARMLAELGYNVLAADVYGKGVRPLPPAAGEEAGKYKKDRALFRLRLRAALATLEKDERTASGKIAAIGYCFGGTGVLELARSGADLAGVVSFHGNLDAAEGMAASENAVKTKILVCHGAADPHVPAAQVLAFQDEMTKARADWQFITYSGAVHSFTQKSAGGDPSKGSAYNERADKRSWEAMKSFLAEIFR